MPYIAPEVLTKSKFAAEPTDVWGCGMVLLVMLTGGESHMFTRISDPRFFRERRRLGGRERRLGAPKKNPGEEFICIFLCNGQRGTKGKSPIRGNCSFFILGIASESRVFWFGSLMRSRGQKGVPFPLPLAPPLKIV